MNKTIVIGLNGHAERYRLEEDAYDRLARYLDRAASRLQDDPDRAEILGDLERSVGDKLGALVGSDDRLVTATDIDGILEAIGAVDTGHDPGTEEASVRPRAAASIGSGRDRRSPASAPASLPTRSWMSPGCAPCWFSGRSSRAASLDSSTSRSRSSCRSSQRARGMTLSDRDGDLDGAS